jgi:hypothetical protein
MQRAGDAAMISGYMGFSETFDDAICEIRGRVCGPERTDYRAFVKAVREGQVEVIIES